MRNLLIIDDNLPFLDDVESLLKKKYNIFKANTSAKGLQLLKTISISAVLLDLELPDIHGLDVLLKIKQEIDQYMPVIIITEFDDTENVVNAMRLGAFDFLSKDFNLDLLEAKLEKAMNHRKLQIEVSALQNSIFEQNNRFVFTTEIMKQTNFEITRLSKLNFDVLITGETGVGKDLIAALIHERGPRKDKPFISIPLRSLSEHIVESELFGHEKGAFSGADKLKIGKFEAANYGTIYIPEISCLNESMQLKLLHFMQYKSISRVGQDPRKGEIKLDIRLIMATNDNLEELVSKHQIREDFYYRISGVKLEIPPLRKRVEDIEPLTKYFVEKYSATNNIRSSYEYNPELFPFLQRYNWPGNVRELENSIKNALYYAVEPVLNPEHFPNVINIPANNCRSFLKLLVDDTVPSYKDADMEFKRQYFKELIKRTNGRISEVAKIAGITPQGVRKILNAIGITNKKEF